ncbi:MAG: hypothetical protein Kow0022_04790 [Phycisphaerales bacterium]
MLLALGTGPEGVSDMVLTLGVSPVIAALLIALFLCVCVMMILIVLIQRPQGGGLSGAFGAGGGSGQTAFGAKTGDALTIATIGIFIVYLVLAVILQFAARPETTLPQPATVSTPAGSAGQDEANAPPAEPATTAQDEQAPAAQPSPEQTTPDNPPAVESEPASPASSSDSTPAGGRNDSTSGQTGDGD